MIGFDLMGIPLLSNFMLMLLALLMTAVAYRVLRTSEGNVHRLVGLMILAGGIVLTGYNIKYSYALVGGVTVSDPAHCSNGATLDYDELSLTHEQFLNNCPNALTILTITTPLCISNPVFYGTCMVGNIVAGNGGSCTLPNCALGYGDSE